MAIDATKSILDTETELISKRKAVLRGEAPTGVDPSSADAKRLAKIDYYKTVGSKLESLGAKVGRTDPFAGSKTFRGRPSIQTGIEMSKYSAGMPYGMDPVDYMARQQSAGEQIAFGLGRLVGTTATKLLEGLGYAGYALPALLQGNADVMLDNAFSSIWSNTEDALKEAMPIMHSQKYLQGNILNQMGTLGFWMDDVVDGAAFMLSNLVGAKGVGMVGKGIGGYSKLAKSFSQATRAIKAGKAVGTKATNLVKWVNTADLATMSLYNSVTEASFEAKDLKDSLMAQGLSNEEASGAAMNAFWSNVVVLMGPNMVTNSMVFKAFRPSRGAISSVYKNGRLVSESLKDLTRGDVAGIFAKKALISMASEGLWEENIQLAIQNYETSLALGEEDRGRLAGLAEEWVSNFTTDEGQKAMVLGAIIGLIPGGIGGVRQAKGELKQAQFKQQVMSQTLQAYQDRIEDFIIKDEEGKPAIDPKTGKTQLDFAELSNAFRGHLQSMSNMANSVVALEAGNETMYRFLTEQKLASLSLAFLDDPDGLEHLKNEIDALAEKELETLKQLDNYEAEEGVHELKARYLQRAEQYSDMYNSIVNNYTAFVDFGDTDEARKAKHDIVNTMFMEAANQNFWVERRKEVEAEISKKEASELEVDKKEVKRLEKERNGINQIIQNSEAKFRDIASTKSQKEYFEGRLETNRKDELVAEGLSIPVTDVTGKELTYEGKAEGEVLHTVVNKEGELEKLSDEEVKELALRDASGNYIVEPDILVDEEGNEYILDGKEGKNYRVIDAATGDVGLVTPTELKEYNFKQREVGTVEEEIVKKDKERLTRYAENRAEFADLLKAEEGSEARLDLDRALEEEIGTKKYDNYKFNEIFDRAGITGSIPSVYRGEVGDLYRQGNKIIFKALTSDTRVEFDVSSKLTLGDLSISIYKNFVFDIVMAGPDVLLVNGVLLTNKSKTPTEAIRTNKEGIPIAIALWKGNKKVIIRNPTIVADLAVAIPMLENIKHKTLDYIKESKESFVMVRDPKSRYGREYAVYNVNGEWVVADRLNGKRSKEYVAARVVDEFFRSITERINKFSDFIEEQNTANLETTREDIQNELREYDDIIRQATPREINESKSAAEISDPDARVEEEERFPDEQENGKQVEQDIINDKADEMAEQRTKDELASEAREDPLEDDTAIEAVNEGEVPGKYQKSVRTSKKEGIDPSSAVAYNYKDNPEFDRWISQKDNNLNAYTAHLSISYEDNQYIRDWWAEREGLRASIENQKLNDEGVNTVLYIKNLKEFTNEVDRIPIKMELRDADGNLAPGKPLFLHTTDFVSSESRDRTHNERMAVRAMRSKALRLILKGENPIITRLSKTQGKANNIGEESIVTDVLPIKGVDIKLGISNGNNFIVRGDNTEMKGVAKSAGSVFIETNHTASGRSATVKLNTQKLSSEHAGILLNALIQAYTTKKGYGSKYVGDAVSKDMTVGEVIRYLVLEGKLYTAQSERTDPRPYLIPKQLWVEERVIHYGESGLFDITEYDKNSKSADPAKKQEARQAIKDFKQWAKTHKNYAIMHNDFGKPLDKDFRIGSLQGVKGESYDSFVVKHGLVKTDLHKERPFIGPTIMFDPTTLKGRDEVIDPTPAKPTVVPTPVGEEVPESVETELLSASQFIRLPVGTVLYNVEEDEEGVEARTDYFIIKEDAGIKKLQLIVDDAYRAKKYKDFGNIRLDNFSVMEELLVNFMYKSPLTVLVPKVTVKPVEVEAKPLKDEPKTADKRVDPADYFDNVHRMQPRDLVPYKLIDIEKEVRWLKRRLPKGYVHIVDDLIKVGGELAYGQVSRDAITLSKLAEVGTAYHEAFHRVSLSILTDSQREAVYADARKKYKLEYETERFVEEHLAERFREFVLAKDQESIKKKLPQKIKAFFQRLWDFIFGVNSLEETEVERLFEAIEAGRFKYKELRYDNKFFKDTIGYLKNHLGLSSKRLSGIVKTLTYMTFRFNKVETIEDVNNIKFDKVFEQLQVMHDAMAASGRSDDQITAKNYETIIKNSKYFVELVESYLRSMKISRKGLGDPLEHEYEGGSEQSGFERLGLASYESDFKDNMLASIKMLVMTLKESGERDPYLNYHQFVDFGSTWNRIMSDLHDAGTIKEMLKRLDERSEGYSPYQELSAKLKAGSEMLRTQFEVSVNKAKHKFLDLTFTMEGKKPIFQFQDTDIQRATKRFVKEWSELLFDSKLFVKDKLQETAVNEVMDRYKELAHKVKKDFDRNGTVTDKATIMSETVKLLNSIGIPIDHKVLSYRLVSKGKSTMDEAIKDFFVKDINHLFGPKSVLKRRLAGPIETERGDRIPDTELFTDEKSVEALANDYMISKPEEMTVTVLGPAGNPYFVYSPNNHITDTIKRFKKDQENIKALLNTVNSKNSYILKQLYNNPEALNNFDVHTFSGFIEKNVGDVGRDYFGLNRAEDFLFKLSAVHAGYKYNKPTKGLLPMPTLADRKTYYLFKGLDVLDYEMTMDNGQLKIPADSVVIDTFMKYAEDEKARITEVKRQVDRAVATKKSSNLVENFHYKLLTDVQAKPHIRGPKARYERVGKDLVKVFVDFKGNYMGNGVKYHHLKAFNKEDNEGLRNVVVKALQGIVDDTINYAAELGIITITKDKNGRPVPATNLLLDDKLVDKVAEQFGGNTKFAMKKILANHAVNTMMADIEVEKMFSGDLAFYKGETSKKMAEDKIKRLSVNTSTGDNTRTEFPEGHELHGKFDYNVTTLNTSYVRYQHLEALTNRHIAIYKMEAKAEGREVTDAQARKSAEFKLKKLGHVDQTDAQVYISPSMYRSLMIRLGEWGNDKQAAFNLLESDTVPSAEEEKKALNLLMPPQKFVHFGLYARNNLAVPIFDKMSMATLFKRIVKDTNLEELYNRMELKGKFADSTFEKLDMVKFDTAVKVGNTERSNYYEDKNVTKVSDLLNNPLAVQTQKFENLRRQLLTEPHDVEKILLGTQVRKLGMSNVRKNAKYTVAGTKMSGREMTDQWIDLLKTLSNKGKVSLLDRLGISRENGSLKIKDATKLVEQLKSDAIKSGLPDNVIDMLKVDENGDMYMTIDALPERKWIYSRLISMVGRATVDIELPGNAFIQMTNFGFDKMSDEELDLKRHKVEWLDEESGNIHKRPLRFYELNEEGGVEPMECMVSVNLFKRIIPNYKNLTWAQKKAWVKKHPEIMGYRIPTQGLNSISHLKVVGLLPEQMGDTIVLPAEFTALTGSDFDIDKLYVARYNYTEDGKKIGYTEGGVNSEESMHNRLLDIYKAVVTSPHHVTQVTTPLDASTDLVKRVYKDVQDLSGEAVKRTPSLWESSPRYQADVKEKYTGGKGGIGPFALANAHHILGQIAEIGLNIDMGIGNTRELEDRVITALDGVKDVSGEYILDWLSALINAHVDIAKDPYIMDLNVNNKTYAMTNLLVRAGVGELTFYFLPQPILKDLAEEDALQKGSIKSKKGVPGKIIRKKYKELHAKALREEKKSHIKDSDKAAIEDVWDKKRLQKDINYRTKHDSAYYARQLQILDEFQTLSKQANNLNEVVMVSRIDTKQYGSNQSELAGFESRYNKVFEDKAIYNLDALFEDTFLETLFENSVLLSKELFGQLTITGTEIFQDVVDRIITLTGNKYTVDNKYINFVSDELFSAISSRFFINHPKFKATSAKVNKLFFGDNNIVKQVAQVKNGQLFPELQDNRFITLLKTDTEVGDNVPNKLTLHSDNIKEKWDRDDLVRSWEDILDHDNEAIAAFGRNIAMYSFYSSGFNKTLTSFYNFIPNAWLKRIGYADHMAKVLDTLHNDKDQGAAILHEALDEIFVNNWTRTKLSRKLNTKELIPTMDVGEVKHSLTPPGAPRRVLFQIPYDKESDYYMGTNSTGEPIYNPYVKDPSQHLFKYVGYDKETKNGVYKFVPTKKGYYERGFVIKEYYLDDTILKTNKYVIGKEHLDTADAILAGEKHMTNVDVYRKVELLSTSELIVTNYKVDAKKVSGTEVPEVTRAFANYEDFKNDFLSHEANLYNIDISLGIDARKAARKNMIEGKDTQQARDLEAFIRESYDEGAIRVIRIPAGKLTVRDVVPVQKEIEFEEVVKAQIPQNLVSGVEAYGTKQEADESIKAILGDTPHSIDMIDYRLRTRTTRSVSEMAKYDIKVGDIVEHFGLAADGTTKRVKTVITAIHYKGTPEFTNTWFKEGWTQEGVKYIERFKEGAAAIEFEKVEVSPFLTDEEIFARGIGDVRLSTESTQEELKRLRDKYENCRIG